MNRRILFCGLLLLFLAGGTAVLRHDLSRWRLITADRAFRAGDHTAAFTIWSAAVNESSTRFPALQNRGMVRFRRGELAAACADFRAATAASDLRLRQQASYNLGTTLLVMERGQQFRNRQEQEQLLAESLRRLETAVALLPTDTAAGHNRALARSSLSALQAGRPGARSPRGTQEKGAPETVASQQPGVAGTKAGKPGAATSLDSSTGRRRAAPVLSAGQALRILDEARGREALRSGVAAGNRQEQRVPPEKDW